MLENKQNDWNRNVQIYSKEIGKIKKFYSKEEEKEIIKKTQEGDIEARNEIIKSHLRYVFNVAKNYKGSGVNLNDLISEGNLGLIRALEDFDLSKDIKFITYAVWWIKAYIKQAINERQNLSSKEFLSDDYYQEEQDSLSTMTFNSEHNELVNDFLITQEESQIYKEREESLNKLLDMLNERERNIIKSYFGLNEDGKAHTFAEIAKISNMSTERVRQLYHEAINNIRYNIFACEDELSFDFLWT